jgi:hypothetical protein
MSYFRSYFEKNNTLIKNTQVNTSKNPTCEIFYGSAYSRFIFKIDLTELQSKIDNGFLVLDENTRHHLKMTNTIFGDEGLKGQNRTTGRSRATSFRLEIFEINESWNEGYGFDYEDAGYDFTSGNKTFSEVPSNWYKKDTLADWQTQGAFIGTGSTLTTIEFDNGNENLDVDITEYVNGILLSGQTNHGIGIKFLNDYEILTADTDRSVAFFTKYTQTFFEPYMESIFDDRISDNRQDFVEKTYQNLYLYITKGTNYYDLDELPTVDILDSTNTPIVGLSGLTTTKIRKGVYEVTFGIDGEVFNCDGKKFLYDNWKNLSIDGVSLSNVKQKFIPKPLTTKYTIGDNPKELNRYSIQYFGINQNEKVKRGELRKIVVSFRSINEPKTVLFDDVYYRMFIKEGRVDVMIHDWTQIDKTNENSFVLDTSYLIPREYYIEIKGKTHSEEIFYNNYIKFEILSEK